jgi:Phage integrase central domain/Arm DNA-binding domain
VSARTIHRLTEVQIRNARPIEVVVPVPLPPNATAAERNGSVSIVLEGCKRDKPDRSADVRDDKRLRKMLDRFVDPTLTMRDGRPVIVKRKTRWMADGNCLWVKIMPSTSPNDPDGCSKSYVFRYSLPEKVTSANGVIRQRQRQMGLGSCHILTLAEARERARECRKMLLDGVDPIVARDGKAADAMVAEKKLKNWDAVVAEFLLANGDKWSKVHRANVIQSLRDHISPVIGDVPISAVDTQLAIKALTDLHSRLPVTCARVMGRCADVYSYAVLHGYAQEPNPWRYRGHLEFRFPQKTEVKHLPALHFSQMSSLWSKLIKVEGLAALALQWTILTVARTGETFQALASEIDCERQEWRVPKSHIKTRRHMRDDYDFIQPLTDEAMAVLAKIGERKPDERLFPFAVDSGAMIDVLHAINPGVTVHGTTRGAFKTWSEEATDTDSKVVEACMSYKGGASRVELAYHRGPQFVEKKRRHLALWANYVTGVTETADVVMMTGRRA